MSSPGTGGANGGHKRGGSQHRHKEVSQRGRDTRDGEEDGGEEGGCEGDVNDGGGRSGVSMGKRHL